MELTVGAISRENGLRSPPSSWMDSRVACGYEPPAAHRVLNASTAPLPIAFFHAERYDIPLRTPYHEPDKGSQRCPSNYASSAVP